MSRPDDVTGLPVLDRERWDAEADLALGARAIDLTAVRAGAATQRRSRRTLWTGLATAAAVAGLLAVALGPWGARLLSAPVPPAASEPAGLPDRIFAPPLWTPSVTDAPIGRVAAVITAPVTGGDWTRTAVPAPVLVSDDSQYRTLPGRDGAAVSLSKDGRGVAWTPVAGGSQQNEVGDVLGRAVLRWVDVRSGRDGEKDLTVDRSPSEVIQTVWSPDGRWVGAAIQYTKRKEGGTSVVGGALSLVEASTGRVHRICTDCSNRIGFDAVGRVLVPVGTEGALPDGLVGGVLPSGGEAPSTMVAPPVLADGSSRTPVLLGKKDSTTLGQPDEWWLVRQDRDGTRHRIPVPGTHSFVDLLGPAGEPLDVRSVLVRVGDPYGLDSDVQGVRYVVWRIPIDGPDGVTPQVTEVLRHAGPAGGEDLSVLAVSADAAASGTQVPAAEPTFPWWQPSHLRWWLAGGSGLGWPLLIPVLGLGVVLLGTYRGVQGVRRRLAWRRERIEAEQGAGGPES